MRAGLVSSIETASQDYVDADTETQVMLICFMALLFVEFLILFSGATLFSTPLNIVLIGLHCCGILSLLYFQR